MKSCIAHCSSPIGILRISGTEDGVEAIGFINGWDENRRCLQHTVVLPAAVRECMDQLHEYFSGGRTLFRSLRQRKSGTEFQCHVWEEVSNIPCGETVTYGDIAKLMGYASAAQAVGMALAKNPLAIIIPCHRVIPEEGDGIGGYAWDVWRKRWLLRHEESVPVTHCCRVNGKRKALQ